MKIIPIAINHYSLSYKVKHFQIKMIKSKLMIAAISYMNEIDTLLFYKLNMAFSVLVTLLLP